MLFLVGVGHVFPLRGKVKSLIRKINPDAVCVELDQVRYRLLLEGVHGGGSFPLNLLSKMYERASEMYGAQVGEEMLGAVEAAKELSVPYFFIDVPVEREIPKALRSLPFGERMKLYFSAVAVSLLPQKMLKSATEKVMEDPEAMKEEFEQYYPELKRMLLDYREEYMAERLRRVIEKFPVVVAVVGEGHIEGLKGRLGDVPIKVIHLRELVRGEVAEETTPHEESTVSFTFTFNRNPWEGVF
ncbi:MAG: TraB/GumN family protein [Thermoplasmata archaeon]|nr:TraB/GumN family protein [Thermoplasmata archaeon]